MNTTYIVMIVAIVTTIIAIVIYNMYGLPKEYTFGKDAKALSTPTVELASDKVASLLEKNEMTLSMYVFLSGMDRTRTTESISTNPLVEMKGIFSLEAGSFDTNLVVQNPAEPNRPSVLHLPMIPQQKWVYLTILQSGRKFDVMYNDLIVGSKVFDHMPVYTSTPLVVGNAALQGMYIYGTAVGVRRTKQNIVEKRAKTSDTRGEPVISFSRKVMNVFSTPVPSLCAPGVACNDGSITASPGVLNMWETNYA